MKHIAEFVSKGHPDRLADAVVESLVQLATERDPLAFCAVECAVVDDHVFVDGRIAAGRTKPAIQKNDVEECVHQAYESAGYNAQWLPLPQQLHIHVQMCIEPLVGHARSVRVIADDQNIVVGYAYNNAVTNYLPPTHYVALYLGHALTRWREQHDKQFGPDFKLLVQMDYNPNVDTIYRLTDLSISIQHAHSLDYTEQKLMLFEFVREQLTILEQQGLKGISHFESSQLMVNGCGVFEQGGPFSDNGLSGKKLVVDFYGPEVPIGGGAICGKDFHKIDVCGAFYARQLAVQYVMERQCNGALVRLGWRPGDKKPSFHEITAYDSLGMSRQCAIENTETLISIKDIQQLQPHLSRLDLMRQGYFYTFPCCLV